MACTVKTTEYACNDSEFDIFRKILQKLNEGLTATVGDVTLNASDLQIGAIEIKDAGSDTRAKVRTDCPDSTDAGLVVRNIPCGIQQVEITDGSLSATVRNAGANDALNVAIVDAAGNHITSFGAGSTTQYDEDTAAVAGDKITMAGVVRLDAQASLVDTDGDRTQLQVNSTGALRVDGSGVTQPISALSLPLPTGAATEATLLDVESLLTSIDTNVDVIAIQTAAINAKLPAALVGGRLDTNIGSWLGSTAPTVGQKTMAASIPVVFASDQSALSVTLTAGGTTQYAEDTQHVSGDLLTIAGVIRLDTQASLCNADGDRTALQVNAAGGLRVDGSAVTQPISAASLPLPTGAATEATLLAVQADTNNIHLTVDATYLLVANIDSNVTAIAADTASIATSTASIDAKLPAALVGGRLDTNIGSWLGSTAPTVGQKTMADSIPVTFASNQSALSVTLTAGGTTQYAEDTASVAADMVTMAGVVRRDTIGTLVDADNDRTQLQVNSSGSLRVDGSAVTQPISAASLPLPSGAATEATLATRASEATLSAMSAKLPATLGQKAMAASMAVVIASDQSAVPTKEQPDATATFCPSAYDSTAYENSEVVKASAGVLYDVCGYSSRTTGQWIQIHNTTSVPSNGAVPKIIFFVPPLSNFFFDTGKFGKFFSTGITIVNSTTGPTLTLGSADTWFNVLFQ